METLPSLTLYKPTTLPDAVSLLSRLPRARPIAGGTDLIPNLRDGLGDAESLVDVSGVAGLDRVDVEPDGMTIGSGVTLALIVAGTEFDGPYVAIREAATAVAGPSHRTVATVGGNLCLDTRCVYYNQSTWWRKANHHCLKYGGETCHVAPQGKRCHAAFAGDLAPALLALDAVVEIAGPGGLRTTSLDALYAEDGRAHLTIARDEIIAGVRLPFPAAGLRSGYRKARARAGLDFPLAGVAAALTTADDKGTITSLRVALTGTNSRPFVLQGTDALLGAAVNEASLQTLAKLVQKQVSPMRTTVTSSNYRRQVAAVLAQRLVAALAAGQ